ncbi:MAG: hypothetical protein FWG78_03450 [Coriobacteriia bacterium]|nr:hypothetical protein [Coriobacteriia bacterium]
MKKRLLLLGMSVVLMCSAFLLVGCGDNTEAEAEVRATVEDMFAALNSGNFEAANVFIVDEGSFGAINAEAAQDMNAALENGITYVIKDVDFPPNKLEVELVSGETITGDQAVVELEITRRDTDYLLTEAVQEELVAYMQELKEQDALDTLDEDQILQLTRDTLRKAEPTITTTVTARLVKVDDTWLLVGEQELVDAILGTGVMVSPDAEIIIERATKEALEKSGLAN